MAYIFTKKNVIYFFYRIRKYSNLYRFIHLKEFILYIKKGIVHEIERKKKKKRNLKENWQSI